MCLAYHNSPWQPETQTHISPCAAPCAPCGHGHSPRPSASSAAPSSPAPPFHVTAASWSSCSVACSQCSFPSPQSHCPQLSCCLCLWRELLSTPTPCSGATRKLTWGLQTQALMTNIMQKSLTCSAGQRSAGIPPCTAPGVQQLRNENLWQTCSLVLLRNEPVLWTWFSPRQSPPSVRASWSDTNTK